MSLFLFCLLVQFIRAGWQIWGVGEGMEGLSKKEKGLMYMDMNVVIVEEWGGGYKGDKW